MPSAALATACGNDSHPEIRVEYTRPEVGSEHLFYADHVPTQTGTVYTFVRTDGAPMTDADYFIVDNCDKCRRQSEVIDARRTT